MKEKGMTVQGNNFYAVLPLGCRAPVRYAKRGILRRLVQKYQKEIDATLAATAIGTMLLMGIWGFLIELAAC